MKITLLTLGAVALLASPSLFADETKSQVRTQDTAEYKEDVQHKYRYQTEEQKRYKGENQSKKYQYQHRNNMNDAAGSDIRSMDSTKGGGKR